ncbi:22521_t:CDS:2, partial [Gigaspora margarita]
VRILNNWCENIGYNYSIETIQSKPQLEQEMIEFVYSIRKLKDGKEYLPSSVCNAINCLAMYLLDNSLNINKYNLASKQEFRDLWKALDGKMKQLKKIEKVARHHDPLTTTEIQTIFAHEAISISYPQGLHCLQFTKFLQKNDQNGIDGNLDSLTIPVPPDSEGLLGSIHNIKLYIECRPTNVTCDYLHLKISKNSKAIVKNKWYLDSKLGIKTCGNLMKSICNAVGINIQESTLHEESALCEELAVSHKSTSTSTSQTASSNKFSVPFKDST